MEMFKAKQMNHTYKCLYFSTEHKGNLESLAEIETSTLQPFTEMNPVQMILLSSNVSGRVFSSLQPVKFSCILFTYISHVLGLGFINAFKHD